MEMNINLVELLITEKCDSASVIDIDIRGQVSFFSFTWTMPIFADHR